MALFNAATSKITFIDGDVNGDGDINAKDLRACPTTDIANELKPLIDVTVNGFTIVDGVATITLTDGSTFTDTANGPVEATYTPDINGDVVIPLTDGGAFTLSGIVSPPDVDFASTTTTVLPSGAIRINYFDSNGDPITTSTIPSDVLLGSLALGADGCTLEGTLDDGTVVSVSLCDLISEVTQTTNADGSITFTHSSENISWTIAPPAQDCDDNVIDNSVTRYFTLDNLLDSDVVLRMQYIRNDVNDPTCEPRAPTGKFASLPHETMHPTKKDIWHWDGSSWSVNINPASKEIGINQYSLGGVTNSLDEADLISRIGLGDQDVAVVSRTLTNNDCVPWKYMAYVRAGSSFDNLEEDSVAVWKMGTGSNHTAPLWVGDPISRISGAKDTVDVLRTDVNGTIQPGQTLVFEAFVSLRVDDIIPNTISAAALVGFTGRIDIWRDSGIAF